MKTLSSKIAKSNNANGTNPKNNDYKSAIQVLTTGKDYTNYSTGSGKWSNSADCNPAKYLTIWGIDFEIGNDAPRGGKSGNYVALTKKGLTQVKNFRAELEAKTKIEIDALELIVSNAKIAKQNKVEEIKNFISENKEMINSSIAELNELKSNGNHTEWQIKANSLVLKVSKANFAGLHWKEIYSIIRTS